MGNSINTSDLNAEELQQSFEDIFFKSPNQDELSKRMANLLNEKFSETRIIEGIVPIKIRKIIEEKKEYFEFFIQFLVDYLYDQTNNSKNGVNDLEANLIRNVLRILSKILPIMHEKQYTELTQKVIWDYVDPNYSLQQYQASDKSEKIVIYKCDQENINQDRENYIPLGIKLLEALMKLCFLQNFAIESQEVIDEAVEKMEKKKSKKDQDLGEMQKEASEKKTQEFLPKLWCGLMGFNKKFKNQLNNKPQFFENRIAILQCLASCLGNTLYQPNQGENYFNPWILFITSPKNQYVFQFTFSLLYFVLGFKQSGYFPFQGKLTLFEDQGIKLSELCSSILLVLMNTKIETKEVQTHLDTSIELTQIFDYFTGDQIDSKNLNQSVNRARTIEQIQLVFYNEVQVIIQQFQHPNYILTILDCILGHLERPIKEKISLLPEKDRQLKHSKEMVGILYSFIQLNDKMLEAVGTTGEFSRILKILVWHVVHAFQQKDDNLFFLCLGILTNFTQNPNFNVCVSNQLDFSLNIDFLPIVSGTYGDLLIVTISTLILNAYENMRVTYSYNWLGILLNVSPYMSNLSELSAVKLSQLLNLFSNYNYMLLDQYNALSLLKLIQIYENLLSYFPESNNNIINELWKKKKHLMRTFKINFDEKTINYFFQFIKHRIYQQNNVCLPDSLNPEVIKNSQIKIEVTPQEQKVEQQLQQQYQQNWVNFEWKKALSNTKTKNTLFIFKEIEKYTKENQIPDEKFNIKIVNKIIKNEEFKKGLHKYEFVIRENFQDSGFSDNIQNKFTWNLFQQRCQYYPYFDIGEVIFFKNITKIQEQIPEQTNQEQQERGQQRLEQQQQIKQNYQKEEQKEDEEEQQNIDEHNQTDNQINQ